MADINKVYLSSLILAYLLQFQNVTLLTSPLLSLLIGSVLARYFQVKLRMFDDTFLTFSFHSAGKLIWTSQFNWLHMNNLMHFAFFLALLLQQKMKIGPLVARVLKLFLHFHLVFTTGITFNYLLKVKWGNLWLPYCLKVCTNCSTVISFTETAACQWEWLHPKVSGGQIWPEHNNVSLTAWTKALIHFEMALR